MALESAVKVLLVDDEPEVTRSLRRGLRKEPWDIVTADSAEEALERLAESPFDVVVSDERMPGMQGSDLLSHVRTAHPSAIRIILSGQASVEAAVKAINSAEVYRFLVKPCPSEEVVLTIIEALHKRAERRNFDEWRKELGHDQLVPGFERVLGSLWMGFQPIVRSADESVYGYEALVRTDDQEIASPGELFATAEALGRSVELGARIRDAVAERIGEAPHDATIFVNVNPDHLADESLYASDSRLATYAERVVLEITERESLASDQQLLQRIESLRGLGYRIAIDDLGSGFSGLNSLVLLSPEFVKLDMELVRSIDRSPTKQRLVKAMTTMCRDLGIKSIAEGVETVRERDGVTDAGSTLLQGFLYGKADRGFRARRRAGCEAVDVDVAKAENLSPVGSRRLGA